MDSSIRDCVKAEENFFAFENIKNTMSILASRQQHVCLFECKILRHCLFEEFFD